MAVFLSGCRHGDELERVAVAGTITYRGQPVAEGRIRFVPSRETVAPVYVGEIHNGNYAAAANGGVPVGTHKVEIVAHRAKRQSGGPQAAGIPEGVAPLEQYIPEKYNRKTELEITVPSGSSKITKNFDLTD